jgi:hypothetical protein
MSLLGGFVATSVIVQDDNFQIQETRLDTAAAPVDETKVHEFVLLPVSRPTQQSPHYCHNNHASQAPVKSLFDQLAPMRAAAEEEMQNRFKNSCVIICELYFENCFSNSFCIEPIESEPPRALDDEDIMFLHGRADDERDQAERERLQAEQDKQNFQVQILLLSLSFSPPSSCGPKAEGRVYALECWSHR